MWVQNRSKPVTLWLIIFVMHAAVLTLLNRVPKRLASSERPWAELRLIPEQSARRGNEPFPLLAPSVQRPAVQPLRLASETSSSAAVPPSSPQDSVAAPSGLAAEAAPEEPRMHEIEAPLNLTLPRHG